MQVPKHVPALIILIAALTPPAIAQNVVVPGSATTEGNDSTVSPLSGVSNMDVQTIRYQQVYNSSLFSSLTGPSYVTAISFRSDVSGGPFTDTIANIQVDLSTTQAAADGLSTTFTNNVGANDKVVYSGPLTFSSSFTGPRDGPKSFDITVTLQTPFLFNPSQGNLLLDIHRNTLGFVTPGQLSNLDAVNSATDGVSSVYTYNSGVASPTADFSSTKEVVTQFTFTPAPVPETSTTVSLGLLLAFGTGVVAFKRKRCRPMTPESARRLL